MGSKVFIVLIVFYLNWFCSCCCCWWFFLLSVQTEICTEYVHTQGIKGFICFHPSVFWLFEDNCVSVRLYIFFSGGLIWWIRQEKEWISHAIQGQGNPKMEPYIVTDFWCIGKREPDKIPTHNVSDETKRNKILMKVVICFSHHWNADFFFF